MRSFQSILFLLLGALLSLAFAAESPTYETTVYLTNTVTQVYTITKSGAHPTGVPVNSTSIIKPTYATAPYPSGNATVTPTGTAVTSQSPVFTGAASQFHVNAFVALLAAGVGYLAL